MKDIWRNVLEESLYQHATFREGASKFFQLAPVNKGIIIGTVEAVLGLKLSIDSPCLPSILLGSRRSFLP